MPSTLKDALNRTRNLQYVIPSTRFPPRLNSLAQFKNQIPPPMKNPSGNFRRDNVSKYRDEFRRRKLCFTYQEPWVPGHKCDKGKEHYIEVFSNREVEDEEEETQIDA